MEEIQISFYIQQTTSHGMLVVKAFSLQEAIEIARKTMDYKIFIYSIQYVNIPKVLLSL